MNAIDRRLAALGRHATLTDGFYWAYAVVAIAIGVIVGLATGLWGLGGLVLAGFSFFTLFSKSRYQKSLSDS